MDNKIKKEINTCVSSIKDNQDMQSVCRLHELTGGVFRHIALRYLGNLHDSEDLVQDFWAEIFVIASKYRFNTNAFAYLCKTFTNMTINYCIKKGREINRNVNYIDYENIVSDNGSSVDNLILCSVIDSAIGSLKKKKKIIVQLTYFEDLTVREIAKMISKSKSQVDRIKKEALAKLKNKLAEYDTAGAVGVVQAEKGE